MTDRLLKPDNWDPRTEPDQLLALAQLAEALHHGRPAFEARLAELAGGYPSRGGGGRGGGELTPAEAGADAAMNGEPDAAKRERDDWEKALRRALDHACVLWAQYKRVSQEQPGVAKMADPGCELCAQVSGHWCPVFGVRVILSEPKSKREKPTTKPIRLCDWCFRMTWDSRMGRLPIHDEVSAHAEGRRVNWRGGAEPKLVEVRCPDCGGESREARRNCSTCLHSGVVLKVAS